MCQTSFIFVAVLSDRHCFDQWFNTVMYNRIPKELILKHQLLGPNPRVPSSRDLGRAQVFMFPTNSEVMPDAALNKNFIIPFILGKREVA